jgi:ferric-dicitrate binding protein FerR (iron transport regulator)
MPVALAYCTCMNNRMSNNETRSITQWEKANPNAQEAWQQAGWLGEEIIITLRLFPRKRESREARPGLRVPAFAGRADAGCIALIADPRLRVLVLGGHDRLPFGLDESSRNAIKPARKRLGHRNRAPGLLR